MSEEQVTNKACLTEEALQEFAAGLDTKSLRRLIELINVRSELLDSEVELKSPTNSVPIQPYLK